MPESAWATCVISAGCPLGLEEFVTRHAAHDRTHGKQIEGILERHALLGRLHAMPGELAALLELATAPGEEVRQVLQRLADAERRYLLAYARILEQDRPQLGWLAATQEPPARPAAALATLRRDFEKLRGATHALLYASGPRAWQRRGIDPRLGERTMAELVARQLDHDDESLAALRDVLTWAPASSPPR